MPPSNWQWPHLARGLILAFVSPTVLAKTCTEGSYNAEITRQEDLDAIARDCTKLEGGLTIWSNYTGPFSLSNVTKIASGIYQYPGVYMENTAITTMEFPDLVEAEDVSLSVFVNMSRLSLPKLETVGHLTLEYFVSLPAVELPELRNASGVSLMGNYSAISLEKLETVSETLKICNTVDCSEGSNSEASMDISLPALKKVEALEVIGNVSSLSVPELTTVEHSGEDYWNSQSILSLALLGETVAVDFPKLNRVEHNFAIKGNISSLSLPSLQTYSNEFSVQSNVDLNVSLPVEGSDKIKLEGSIQSAEFPNLVDFNEIRVESDLNFDCGALIDALKKSATNVTVERDDNVFCIGAGAPFNDNDGTGAFRCSAGAAAVVAAVVTLFGLI